jgi:DNA-binding MarR family transcriptional regulator
MEGCKVSRPRYKGFDFREFTFELVRHQQAIADKLGINLTDFKALGLLHRRGEMTPKQLAETMGMSAAAMTTVIDRLEKASYAERKRQRADRRSLSVRAVQGSERKVELLYKSLLVSSKTMLPAYTKGDIALISNFLTQATEVFRAATAKLRSRRK